MTTEQHIAKLVKKIGTQETVARLKGWGWEPLPKTLKDRLSGHQNYPYGVRVTDRDGQEVEVGICKMYPSPHLLTDTQRAEISAKLAVFT